MRTRFYSWQLAILSLFLFLRHQPGRRTETSQIKNGEAFCRRHVQVCALNMLPKMSVVIAFLLLGRFGEPKSKYYTTSKILCTAMTNCSTYLFPQFIHWFGLWLSKGLLRQVSCVFTSFLRIIAFAKCSYPTQRPTEAEAVSIPSTMCFLVSLSFVECAQKLNLLWIIYLKLTKTEKEKM